MLDVRTLILVDAYARSDALLAERKRALNGMMASISRSRENAIIARWTSRMVRDPNCVLPKDPVRLHLTREGVLARIELYGDSVNSVRSRT